MRLVAAGLGERGPGAGAEGEKGAIVWESRKMKSVRGHFSGQSCRIEGRTSAKGDRRGGSEGFEAKIKDFER